jgi:glycosyltransferase involved in cell wall biosynthesis
VFEPSEKISKGAGKIINGFINNTTADCVIAVADAAKDNIVRTGVDEKRIEVIKNGVEPLRRISDEEKLCIKSGYNVSEEEFLIGIVARLNYVKGHVYILEALKKLVDDGIKVKLLIAGTGDYEEEIRRKAAELDVAQNVIMAGFVEDVTGIMNVLDLNLNASFGTEATSLSLLEGMSVGCPAVVSDFGGNPGVVSHGENGLIFRQCDSLDMYEKIKSALLDDGKMQSLKKGAEKVFNSQFRAEVMTKSIEDVYERVMGR